MTLMMKAIMPIEVLPDLFIDALDLRLAFAELKIDAIRIRGT